MCIFHIPVWMCGSLHILLLIDIWVISTLGLLWIKLPCLLEHTARSAASCISRIEIAGQRISIYFPSVVTASFPKWLHQLTLPPAVWDSSGFSTSPPRLGIYCHDFGFSCSGAGVEVSRWGFDLRCPNNWWRPAPFMCSSAIWMASFRKGLFRSFASF